jgi:hypothetical protein
MNYLTAFLVGPESGTKIRGACPIGTDETDKTPFMHPENPPKDMIAWRFVSFVSADLARSQDFRGVIERLKGQADNDGVLRDDPTDLFNQLTDKPPRPPRKSRWRT